MAFHFTIPNASIQDTLRYILNFVNQYSTDSFVQKFAEEFEPAGDKEAFIRRVFDYICENGYYQLDKDGHEEVWTPAKIISTRNAQNKFQYDCKKISILLGSVLKAAGIEPVLKHVYYSDGKGGYKDYTHIYIVVPASSLHGSGAHTMEFRMDPYFTVDPTNNCMWNTEVDHDKATLYFLNGKTQEAKPMDLHMMGNNNKQGAQSSGSASLIDMFGTSAGCVESDMNAIMGCPDSSLVGYNDYARDADSIGLKNSYFSYTAAELAGHIAKVPVLSIPRNAFLGVLYLGKLLANTPFKLNIAARLAHAWQKDKAKVQKTWWLLGGTADAHALQQAIIKGSGITISGPVGKGYDYPIDVVTPWIQELKAKGMGIAPAALAAIATATPIFIKLLDMLHGMGIVKPGETDPKVPEDTAPPADPPPPPPPGGGGNPPGPKPGSMLDLSSPVNTITKAVFLMGLSSMFSGPHFFILNGFCLAAIFFSLTKISFRWTN